MAQERLQGLALFCIESELAKTIDYDSIIDTFAARKDRKAALWVHVHGIPGDNVTYRSTLVQR